MADGVTLGFLQFVLDLDDSRFEKQADNAIGALGKLRAALVAIDGAMARVGKAMTTRITLPVTGLGAAAIKVAGDFEASMGKVAISTNAAGETFDGLRKLAIGIGADTKFGATEAADAIDELAKTGVSAEEILAGAGRATANLAAAAGSELAPAASAVSDVMQQFGMHASQLPDAVDVITGAVNQSKLSFDDYQQAIAQAGGVAGALGVSFVDFNSALAASSSLFASGSDAGTSFKTFLTRLVPSSKAAAAAMAQYGLSFFDASGKMRPLADIAEQLKVKLGGLSDAAKTDVMTTMFGTDAMRTGIALMKQGGAGLDEYRAKIVATDAAAQAAQRMSGFNAQMEQLGGAFESLAIAVADTGLLTAITAIVAKIADFVSWLATANPTLMKVVVGIVAISAAMGPLILVLGALGATLLPLFLGRMSLIGKAVSLIVNPIGTVAAYLVRFAASMGGVGAIFRLVAPMVLRFLGPVGLLVTAFQLFGDDVIPVLQELGATARATLGPQVQAMFSAMGSVVREIGAAFGALMSGPAGGVIKSVLQVIGLLLAEITRFVGSIVIKGLSTTIQLITLAFQGLASIIKAVVQVLSGEFAGAWNTIKAGVANSVKTILTIINSLAPGATAAMARMYQGVKTWLQDKMGGVFTWVQQKLEAVGGWFFRLYDRVVGHSYVPDMIDGIARHFGRLDTEMVAPAVRATGATGDAFASLRQSVQGILDSIFPDQAKVRELTGKIDELDRAMAAALINPATWAAARSRLRAELQEMHRAIEAAANDNGPPDRVADAIDDEGFKIVIEEIGTETSDALEKAADKSRASWADMVKSAAEGVRGIVDAIKGGDFFDVIDAVLGVFGQLAGMGVFGSGIQTSGGGGGGRTPDFGGFRAMGGPVVPGRNYVVGENGPEWFTPRARGFVTPGNAGGGRGGGQRVEIVDTTGLFVTRVSDISAGQASQAVGAYATGQTRLARRRLA